MFLTDNPRAAGAYNVIEREGQAEKDSLHRWLLEEQRCLTAQTAAGRRERRSYEFTGTLVTRFEEG